MPYELSWFDDKKRVILIRVTGEFTLEESQKSSDEIRSYIVQGTPPVHLIGDLTGLQRLPRNISEIRRAQGNLSQLATTIIVGTQNPIIQFMGNVLARLGGYEVRLVDNLEAATNALVRLDQSLSHLNGGTSPASAEQR